MSSTDSLQFEIQLLKEENQRLKAQLDTLNISSNSETSHQPPSTTIRTKTSSQTPSPTWDAVGHGLSSDQISRYSRQIILGTFGPEAQGHLCRSSILIVGAGGLGSPAALYLAAAGIGRLGIVDRDAVELSNLHRQIIHTERSVGIHKAESAAAACKSINSSISIQTYKHGITPQNALDIISSYDVVLDASDNAPTRYLLSDACVIARKPLVSGAAIGLDGQLTVYCYGDDGPCYRCLFPESPRPESCARCADAGVLGVVPGIIGTMQALEAIKIVSGIGKPMGRKMLIMDAAEGRMMMMGLRAKSPNCVACGSGGSDGDKDGSDTSLSRYTINANTISTYDYRDFTGQADNDGPPVPLVLLDDKDRISVQQLKQRLLAASSPASNGSAVEQINNSDKILLIDVRPLEQYKIFRLPGALHAPWGRRFDEHIAQHMNGDREEREVIVYCRRGNDSQRAVERLKVLWQGRRGDVKDVVGGIEAWAKEVDDEDFPIL